MKKLLLIWFLLIFCFSCSEIDPMEEYEKEDTISTIVPTDEKKEVKEKTFSVLGNSISTFSGYIPSGYANYYTNNKILLEDTWWMQLSFKDDFELASNASWSGSSIINNKNNNPKSYFTSEERLDALSTNGIPDIILILGGTNDWGNSTGYLGDYPHDNIFDLKTFRGAYSYLIFRLHNKYPTTSIVCCSILPRRQSRNQKNNCGITQRDLDESI